MATKRLQAAPSMLVRQGEETSRQFKVPLILFLPPILSGSIFEFLLAFISNEFNFFFHIFIYSVILDLSYILVFYLIMDFSFYGAGKKS
jgi:hypothetical protein